MQKIIDISQEIYQGMPVYPGHLNTAIWNYHTYEEKKRKSKTRELTRLALIH